MSLLKNRGLISKEQKQEFSKPPDPFSIPASKLGVSPTEIKKACLRIKRAITGKEEIIVYGDYDADGICATAIVWETLNSLGAKVMPHIPHRVEEGYGLNVETIKKLKKEKPNLKLIITVDHGIVAHKKIDFARLLGIDVIVTDHHQSIRKKPLAEAVIHTTELSGAGVAWVLVRELIAKNDAREKLSLAAIGTITDLLAVIGPNRSLIKWGLEELNRTTRVGLKSLYQEAGVEEKMISTYEVGFIIGPRLNAAGRIEHALDSLRLLCTRNKERAEQLAHSLGEINRRRQKMMKETALQARGAWLSQKVSGAKIIFVDGEDWEHGVIGLAASKLVEEFYLPVIVISRGEKQSKASARSIDGFNIIEAIKEADNLLIDVGGHPMAAGFTVETKNLDQLKQKLIAVAEQRIESRILERTLRVDCELELEDLNLDFFNQLDRFSPFGIGNPQPDFVSRRLEIVDANLVGRDRRHLKLIVRSPVARIEFSAIGFGLGEYYSRLSQGKKVDLAYNLILNEWNGTRKLELRIKDIKI